MESFYNNIIDAIRYSLSDWKPYIIIGTIIFVTSLNRKFSTNILAWELIDLLVVFAVGYSSYITWYTIKGSENLPEINNLKRLVWEGLKKICVLLVYSTVLTYVFHLAKLSYTDGNLLFFVVFTVLLVFIYFCMIGGLINRYLHHGKILKAFDIREAIRLLLSFDLDSFLRLVLSVIISEAVVISGIVNFRTGFTLTEILYSLLLFFFAPFLLFATRLIGLHVRGLVG